MKIPQRNQWSVGRYSLHSLSGAVLGETILETKEEASAVEALAHGSAALLRALRAYFGHDSSLPDSLWQVVVNMQQYDTDVWSFLVKVGTDATWGTDAFILTVGLYPKTPDVKAE